jgi:hypothetical protein
MKRETLDAMPPNNHWAPPAFLALFLALLWLLALR